MNPIWENCYAAVWMTYLTIPLLYLKLVIVKLLTVVCVFVLSYFVFLFFKKIGIRFKSMFVLESTVLLRTGVI